MSTFQAILTITPLIATSMIAQSNIDQQNAFRSFLNSRVPLGPRGKVLPHWYHAFLWGVAPLGVLYVSTFAASIALHFRYKDQRSGYELWCALFTAGHTAFMSWAWEGIKGTGDTMVSSERNEQALRKWLVVSLIRAVVADFPAWMCAVLIILHAIGR